MYFLDNSAHIFKLPDYNKKPIGYEYDEQDYIFWFEDQNDNTRLSVNNYYGKIINVLFEVSNITDLNNTLVSKIYDIEITCDSDNFKLVKAIDFQNAINKQESILDYIDIENQSKKLSSIDNEDDILIIKVTQDNKNYIMIPIYIIGTSKYSGTWLTNVLIHITSKFDDVHTYCPITIGGVFNDEYESLVIHGKNMGINLPKEILKAINGTSYDNEVFDEELYNKKIKEYLLNYMNIKGELGNYNSAINSLKWFGYQDSIELYKLLETDNQFQTQYVRDYFEIQQDIIKAFSNFINSQFVGLKYKLNEETGELYKQNINKPLWGEGLPILSENKDKYLMKNTGEFLGEKYGDDTQQFNYSSTYLNYTLYELMFKLSYLKYYYQTYFLPIFIILKNLHIEYKVYSIPNKYLTYTYDHIYEEIVNIQNKFDEVRFKDEDIIYFTHQKHYVDEKFNEFGIKNSKKEYDIKINENSYEINDTCLYIPISFILKRVIKYYNQNTNEEFTKEYKGISKEEIDIEQNKYENIIKNLDEYNIEILKDETLSEQSKYFNCILILKDEILDTIIYKSNFSFINNETDNKYLGFVFYPKLFNELYTKLYTYVNKPYILYLNVNNHWYEYKFTTKLPELDVHIGTLEYKYWINDINYLNEIYHRNTKKDNKDHLLKNDDDTYINDTSIIFTINDPKIPNNSIDIDITNYIADYDFFDDPSKYFSNFTQIDKITNTQVLFNTYMNDPDFIYINDIEFGLYNKEIKASVLKDIDELINRHQSKINIINNYKYLNNVHMYYLYERKLKEQYDILRYKQDLSILCKNILIEKYYNYDNSHINNDINTLVFTNLSNNNESNDTLNDYNYYLLGHSGSEYNDNIYLKENQSYYFILERSLTGLSGNNATSLYSYYNDYSNRKNIGYIICEIKNNKIYITNDILYNNSNDIDYSLNEGYEINNIKIENNNIYYYHNYHWYNVLFTFTPLVKSNNSNKYIKYDSSRYSENTQIYAQLDLFFYEQIQVLNVYGYYNEKYCSNFNNEDPNNITCTVTIEDQTIENVKLYSSAKYVEYSDIYNENTEVSITNLNPSLYWTSIEDIDKENFDINTFTGLEIQHGEFQEPDIEYINYLCRDLTGLKGTYKLEIDYPDRYKKIELVVEVFDKDNDTFNSDNPIPTIKYTNLDPKKSTFTLLGNENKVISYLRINGTTLGNQPLIITPHIYYQIMEDIEVKYNKEKNISLANFYKKFFYKKYTISSVQNNKYNTIKEIWDSYIQLNQDNNYDTYLMHGKNSIDDLNEYWYFMFISKNTCDNSKILDTLNSYPQSIEFTDEKTNTKYILKHISTKQLFLINRMKVNYIDNIYHFNGNEMIVCSLWNNKMLPINTKISSKWALTPISHGAKTSNVIYSNTNTAIISIQNSNTYDKGYYNLQVNYSLDGNILNSKTINKKILIK